MTGGTILNRALWINVARLKLLTKSDAPVRFFLEHSPFTEHDEEEIDDGSFIEKDMYQIIGRIYPNSNLYKNTSLRIEMILTSKYPAEPPKVRFLTPVYHPNIETDGTFCHHLISHKSRWRNGTTLVEVIEAVVKHLDEPDPDYAINFDMGKEYIENRPVFVRKAAEMVAKHGLPRT